MSPIRGPLRTVLSATAMLFVLFAIFGCSKDDDLSTPDVSFGTIEIKMPSEKIAVDWHLYGPGDSFRHGNTDIVLHDMLSGQYTIIWTAVDNWTAPPPAKRSLTANATLTLYGEYQDKAPGSDFVKLVPADFIMGSDDGTRKYEVFRDTTIIGVPPIADLDTTVIDTLGYPAEIGRDKDEDRHRVTITYDYQMGKTEITNQEFVEIGNWALSKGHAKVTGTYMYDGLDLSRAELLNFENPDTPIGVQDGLLRLKKPEYAARPIVEVTWYGAASYCDWLSLKEGLTRAYDHSTWKVVAESYRLPTEAEWENACRAGTKTAFSSGEIENGNCSEPALDSAGWFCGNAKGSSHDVGTKAANPWDLSDMHGNVWEWCNDIYAFYEVPDLPIDEEGDTRIIYEDEDLTPLENPIGPEVGENRVIRSGRWLLASGLCRSAGRMMGVPGYQGIHIGFRVAYVEPPKN